MQSFTLSLILIAVTPSGAEKTNPVAKVVELLSSLEQKIISEGKSSQKTYEEFAEWCEDTSKELDFQIRTGKAQSKELKALIAAESANIDALRSKIDVLAQAMARDDADLTAATEIRSAEQKDFSAEEETLTDIVSTLERAIGILEREMAKSGASLLQNTGSIVDALTTMVEASVLSSADVAKLTSLVQSQHESADEDAETGLGAPAAAVYQGHSGDIIDVLNNLLDKAEAQLDAARKKESTALNNFEMLKQALSDQIKFAEKDTASAKKSLSQSQERKSTAEGDLRVTSQDLNEDVKVLADLHRDCMTKAQTFEAETTSRGEELKALAEAKKIISQSSSGAVRQSYGFEQVSLLQVSRSKVSLQLSSGSDLAKYEAVRLIRDIAIKQNSPKFAQLASRMETAMRMSSGSDDPFAKVKGLISDMLDRLETEAANDATHQSWCVKEMAESHEKKEDLENLHAKLSTKIDQMSSRSKHLKGEIATLEKELFELAKSQQEMDTLRISEKTTYDHDRPEMEEGLEGIKLALKILRDYYGAEDAAHAAATGAGGGIIGLLEVIESDFSKGLAEMIAEEESSVAAYNRQSKENAVTKTLKDKDVEYKTAETVRLDKAISQTSSDRTGTQAELDAVVSYLKKLDESCIVQPDTYAFTKRRREAELAGLKQALEILEGEAVLLQGSRHTMRVVRGHGQA